MFSFLSRIKEVAIQVAGRKHPKTRLGRGSELGYTELENHWNVMLLQYIIHREGLSLCVLFIYVLEASTTAGLERAMIFYRSNWRLTDSSTSFHKIAHYYTNGEFHATVWRHQ